MTWDQLEYVKKTPDFKVPKKITDEIGFDETEYAIYCRKRVNTAYAMVVSLFTSTVQLRQNVINAASNAALDETVLEALRLRMKEMQSPIESFCGMLGEPRLTLVSATDPWW